MTEMFEAASSMHGLYRMSGGNTVILHDLVTWIRAYRIDTRECTWLDMD